MQKRETLTVTARTLAGFARARADAQWRTVSTMPLGDPALPNASALLLRMELGAATAAMRSIFFYEARSS